jgi:hypothetical protein
LLFLNINKEKVFICGGVLVEQIFLTLDVGDGDLTTKE